MIRRFTHKDESWDVHTVGFSHGPGSSAPHPVNKHQILIRRQRDGAEYREWISTSELERVPELELQEALDRALAKRNPERRHGGLLDGDFVGEWRPGGLYRIRVWNAARKMFAPVPGHEEEYDEVELLRRFDALRSSGDTWIQDGNEILRLIQP